MSREIQTWRTEQLRRSSIEVQSLEFDGLRQWEMRDGRLTHDTGGYFSVAGLRCLDLAEGLPPVFQPIIVQPEIGILGFLLARFEGKVHLLVQAKTEPGNQGSVQLAPTFQCTLSNYRCLHGGLPAPFLEYFECPAEDRPLADSLQSEQGTRFFDKYNRNVMVEVEAGRVELDHGDRAAWRWITVADLRVLILEDFLFNSDARSVIAVCDWAQLCDTGQPFERWATAKGFGHELWVSYRGTPSASRVAQIHDWLAAQRQKRPRAAQIVPLESMPGWQVTNGGIVSAVPFSMSVRYFAVQALDREVPRWTQPLLVEGASGVVFLVAQVREGVLRFLLRAAHEPGFANTAQLTASFITLPSEPPRHESFFAMLEQWEHMMGRSPLIIDCEMSEEGGRFFYARNRYLIALAPQGWDVRAVHDHFWLTLAEITALKATPGILTNEVRSALSLLVHYL